MTVLSIMDQPENGKMPLTSHLEELRSRLMRVLIAVGIGFGGPVDAAAGRHGGRPPDRHRDVADADCP